MTAPVFVEDDRKGPLEFAGVPLGRVSSEGRAIGWHTVLEAWRTSEGRFVLSRTTVRDGVPRFEWEVFSARRDAQEWLGWGALSMALYRAAGWPV